MSEDSSLGGRPATDEELELIAWFERLQEIVTNARSFSLDDLRDVRAQVENWRKPTS